MVTLILTTIAELVIVGASIHFFRLDVSRRLQVLLDSVEADAQSIATRLDELEEGIHALRFDCARLFNANVVDSSLVVRSLMIEPPTE